VNHTSWARWAGWFLGISVILFALLIVAYNTDALPMIGQRTAGGLAMWVATAISVVGSLVTGVVSWLRFKDRSVVVIVATIFGVLGTVLLAIGAIPQN